MSSGKKISLVIGILTIIVSMCLWQFGAYGDKDFKLINAIVLGSVMVFFWLTETMPIYVTALIPLALAGPMGLLTTEQLASAYAHKFVFLFLGGFVLALAMEKWDVHKQIARGIIGLVGSSKSRILLGFILSTGLLSMWISNTATTLMMLPMATAVTHNLETNGKSKFPLYLLLAIAYAASIGGMGTLIGSPPNSAMAGILQEVYGIQVDFMSWMKVGLPLSLFLLFVLFAFFLIRMRGEGKGDKIELDLEKKPWSRNQVLVMVVFGIVAMLWMLHKPITNWTGFKYGDEHVAMLGAIVLFVIPGKDNKPLLVWPDTQKLAWGIIFLFGGGIALAKMLSVNGVIDEIVLLFESIKGIDFIWILIIVVTISVFGTEFMSNTALVNVFIPVIAAFATNASIPLLTICLPVALSASCAFMLPVGTPPNAIVFSSGNITIRQMAKTGVMLNIIAITIVVIFTMLFIR